MGPKLAFLIHKTQKWQFAQVAITKKPTPTIKRDSQTKERG